jgi:hypothetical protein
MLKNLHIVRRSSYELLKRDKIICLNWELKELLTYLENTIKLRRVYEMKMSI